MNSQETKAKHKCTKKSNEIGLSNNQNITEYSFHQVSIERDKFYAGTQPRMWAHSHRFIKPYKTMIRQHT